MRPATHTLFLGVTAALLACETAPPPAPPSNGEPSPAAAPAVGDRTPAAGLAGPAAVPAAVHVAQDTAADMVVPTGGPTGGPTVVPTGVPTGGPTAEPADGLRWIDGPGVLSAVRAGQARGVLVNVWASWCGNCKKEMPMLLSVADAVAEHGIGLMLVSADEPDKRAAASAFLTEFAGGRPGHIVRGRLGPFKRALHPTWKGSIPSTFLFDSSGRLRHTWLGPVYEHELQPVLQAFIAGTLEGDGLGLQH